MMKVHKKKGEKWLNRLLERRERVKKGGKENGEGIDFENCETGHYLGEEVRMKLLKHFH